MENRINIACFAPGSKVAKVDDIWQWDYGQILRIQGLNLPTAVEIHFSLDEQNGEAVRRIGLTQDGVTDVVIPDSMLENESSYRDSYYFFAYIYLSDEESGNTEYKIRAKVTTRSKPEGYNSGDSTFAAILKTVNEIAVEKIARPLMAKVGQVLSVKATDEEGKPTEFEAVNQSGGASEEEIRQAVEDYLTENPIEESDPTVPEWAKQPEKPTYTASEVGALPAGTKIPQSASEVGADAAGTAEGKVSAHNTATDAHNDIRLLVKGLTDRLNTLADSDDTTLDQMSEVVAYIKSNKSLIDAITTGKVSVSDIVDNLTTNVSNKPLSAAQGMKLKALIDAIVVPTKLSELENDSEYAKTTDIPKQLPNPQKLIFTGAVTRSYDGSEEVSVNIPSGEGSGEIDTSEFVSKNLTLVKSVHVEEEVSELLINLDEGLGNRFYLYVRCPAVSDLGSSYNISIDYVNGIYDSQTIVAVSDSWANVTKLIFQLFDGKYMSYGAKNNNNVFANAYFPNYSSNAKSFKFVSKSGTYGIPVGTDIKIYK